MKPNEVSCGGPEMTSSGMETVEAGAVPAAHGIVAAFAAKLLYMVGSLSKRVIDLNVRRKEL